MTMAANPASRPSTPVHLTTTIDYNNPPSVPREGRISDPGSPFDMDILGDENDYNNNREEDLKELNNHYSRYVYLLDQAHFEKRNGNMLTPSVTPIADRLLPSLDSDTTTINDETMEYSEFEGDLQPLQELPQIAANIQRRLSFPSPSAIPTPIENNLKAAMMEKTPLDWNYNDRAHSLASEFLRTDEMFSPRSPGRVSSFRVTKQPHARHASPSVLSRKKTFGKCFK